MISSALTTIIMNSMKIIGLIIMFLCIASFSAISTILLSIHNAPRPNIVLEDIIETIIASNTPDLDVDIQGLVFAKKDPLGPVEMSANTIFFYPSFDRTITYAQTGVVRLVLDPFAYFRGKAPVLDMLIEDVRLNAFEIKDDRLISIWPRSDHKSTSLEMPAFEMPSRMINPLMIFNWISAFDMRDARILAMNTQSKEAETLARFDLNLLRNARFKQSLLTLNAYEGEDTRSPTLDLTITSTDSQQTAEMVAYLDDLQWRDIVPWLGPLSRSVEDISGALSGDMRINYKKSSGDILNHAINLKAQSGSIKAPFLNNQSLAFSDIALHSNGDTLTMSGIIAERAFDARILATERGYKLRGNIPTIRAEDIAQFWPDDKNSLAWEWVDEKLADGLIQNASFGFDIEKDRRDTWQIKNLEATFDAENMYVRYLRALEPVTALYGSGVYKDNQLRIDIKSAKTSDLEVASGGFILVKDFDYVEGQLNLTGPIQGILNFLDNDIMRYKERVDLNLTRATGNVNLDITLDFPTDKETPKEEIHVDVSGVITALSLPNLMGDIGINADTLAIEASQLKLKLSGDTILNAAPSNLTYEVYFSPEDGDTPFVQKLDAIGQINADFMRQTFGPRFGTILQSNSTYELALLEQYNQAPNLSLSLTGEQLSAQSVQFDLRQNFDFNGATITGFRYGRTNGDISISKNEADARTIIKFTGATLDASPFLKADNDNSSQEKTALNNTQILVNADQVIGADNMRVRNFVLDLIYNDRSHFSKFHLNTNFDGAPIVIRLDSQGAKGDTLDIQIDNIGALLSALDVTNGITGGQVRINGQPNGAYGAITGQAIITDFIAQDVPVLGRLINAVSISGLIQLLTNQGISFTHLKSDFEWQKTDNDQSILVLREGRTKGSSLGLTFEGTYNPKTEIIDAQGNVVPVSGVNKAISTIPLIGNILTGGDDKSLVAFSYTMKGPAGDPNVFVNPLSILAPGIFRRIFFESDMEDPSSQKDDSALIQRAPEPANDIMPDDIMPEEDEPGNAPNAPSAAE